MTLCTILMIFAIMPQLYGFVYIEASYEYCPGKTCVIQGNLGFCPGISVSEVGKYAYVLETLHY